jgi:hypothetical protein
VNVVITIFADFRQFSVKKLAFFSELCDRCFLKPAALFSNNHQFFSPIFWHFFQTHKNGYFGNGSVSGYRNLDGNRKMTTVTKKLNPEMAMAMTRDQKSSLTLPEVGVRDFLFEDPSSIECNLPIDCVFLQPMFTYLLKIF